MQQGFHMGLITQWLDKKEWYSAERAAVQCIQGCSRRTKDRMPNLFVLCVNTIIEHCNAENIFDLPLPSAMKKKNLDDLISPERHMTDDVLSEHFAWLFPTDEMHFLWPRGCYFYTNTEDGISC